MSMDNGADTSVPDDDGLKMDKRNRGKGTRSLYIYNGKKEMAKSAVAAWKWPIALFLTVLTLVVAWQGLPSLDAIPWWVWSSIWYVMLGSFVGAPLAGILLYYWRSPSGIELWDVGTPTHEHRHLRIGKELWERMEVRSPWGSEASKADLQRCKINGRDGYEVMDLRIKADDTPVCIATWMGESSADALRTYRMSLVYSRKILSRKAEQAEMLKANREHIIREVAERQVHQMIQTSERSGLPAGDEIESVVSDVLGELGIDDRLDHDDGLDVGELQDIDDWDPGSSSEKTNGHDDEASSIKEMVLRE